MLPLAEQDEWPERVLQQHLEMVREVLLDIDDTHARLRQHEARLQQHIVWLNDMIEAAHARERYTVVV